jgi:light-regulated signal transduction histidine kinase (bacteriophytochrome)
MSDTTDSGLNSLQVKIDALEKHLNLHIDYQRQAVDKAQHELRERLSGMNEFRETLKDQASQFVTRQELSTRLNSLQDKVSLHQDIISNWQGRGWAVGFAVTAVSGSIAAAVSWIIKSL